MILNILPNTVTNLYRYDSLYRLTNEVLSVSAPTGNLGYWYDSVGNRTNRTGSLASLNAGSSSFNANDELGSDIYDANGNTKTNAGNDYRYDFENHLAYFNNRGAVITYDGDGNRVVKEADAVTALYLVDTHNPSGYAQVLEELTSSGGTTTLSRAYTWGSSLISQRQPGVSTNFFVFDGHGSTRLLTDGSGSVVNAFAYDAYGTLIASNGTAQTAYLYCGELFDTDVGLYHNGARELNTGTGRFWTRDTWEGNQFDPVSLHKYLYVANDPIDGIDPSGRLLLISNWIWGNEVHEQIADDFTFGHPDRHYDWWVADILGVPKVNYFPLNLRPDLVDLDTHEVYEIKPQPLGYIEGRAKLALYIGCLKALESGVDWKKGSSYDPPHVLNIDSGLVWALVFPPDNGVILYQLFDTPLDFITATIGVAAAELDVDFGVAAGDAALGAE